MTEHPSNSECQREAEIEIVKQISKKVGTKLNHKEIQLNNDKKLEIDGYSEDPPVLCEVYSHIGKIRGAQYKKVLSDVLKMIFLERRLDKKFKKILAFTDKVAAVPFLEGTWFAECLKDFDIVIEVVSIRPALKRKILKSQKKQKHGQTMMKEKF